MEDVEGWKPKTELGRKVLEGEITSLAEVFNKGYKIKEPEIIEKLVPNLETELIEIGQRKGKFGGGKRTPFKQSQRKTAEGSRTSFSCLAAVGNREGYIGMGSGKASDPVPARELAIRNAKLNIVPIMRGCGSWQCDCQEPHSIPYKIEGKCGSVKILLIPAPKGTGLVVSDEVKKVLRLAGIKDIWSKIFGETRTRFNTVKATFNALKNLSQVKLKEQWEKKVKLGE